MIDENTTIKFQTRQSVQEIIDLVRSGIPILTLTTLCLAKELVHITSV